MKWFDVWFQKKCEQAWENVRNQRRIERDSNMPMATPQPITKANIGGYRNGMTFTIYPAAGGHVMEYNEYDSVTDRSHQRLYIISSEQELGEGIAQVIMMEHLKK